MDIHAAQRIARRFITLPLDKRRLYLEKMLQEGVSPANLPIPEVQSAVEAIPLSFAQERQWFLWQLDPQSTAYNLPMVLRLRGSLDLVALQQCFNQLIARHESLRTRFVQRDEGVSQTILAEATLDMPLTVLAPQADIEAAITGFVEAQTGQLFDLNEGPLLRVSLLQIDGQDHILTFVQHHIVSDGGSIQLMVNELVQLYDACQRGETLVLPALPIQYADYAIWQRHWMEAGERERQLAYWCEQLGDEQPVLALPTDRARPAEQSYRGARFEIALPHALSQRLKQLAQQEKATLFMVLLASFQAFLYRYSGQRDIRVGVPTANRNRVETEHLVGFFVNTQVLRAEVVGEQSFSVLLDQVRQAALGAQDHQDLPFEQLVEALHPQRSLSHAPLFQVMFNHQRMAAAGTGALALQLPGLSIEGVAWENRTAQFDLTLETYESDDGIAAALTYATDLFDALTIERLARHWQTLLQGIVEQPNARVGELPLLDVAEREQMVQDWNATSQPFGGLTHQVIAAQAERTPDAVALVGEQQQLTYRQLNQRANHLAHRLINMGVGPDALVGIAVERSVEMVVGLLAILKAGGAYVPLDTQYPADRLAYMLQDSGAQWLLTQAAVRDSLPIPPGVQVLVLSDTDETLQANPQIAVQPDNLAYVIYTSGSTGRPKGVSVRHRGLANHMAWMCKTLPLQSSDRILQKTAFSFDASVWEFWLPLMSGAQLVMAPPGLAESLSLLWEQVEAQRITVLQLAPSLLQALLPEASDAQLASLKVVLCGGEALSAELSRQLQQRWSGRLINLYGPTEATIDTSSHEVPVDPAGPIVAIGKPIDNVRTYVLSEAFEPCPPGAAGELYIGGDSLARGYHLRPGMTAERFIPDPFASRSGARLYRTGDLVRYRQDGVIDYIGRIDHQVKIRGLRIELGEIEARLLALHGVREAMVLAQGNAGAQVLVAYIIAAAGDLQPASLREQIRAGLKASLPDYMVPTHLLFLQQWPLTVNGKLDRKALPLPDVSRAEHAHVAPRSELEQRIAVIWQDVLKRPAIGVTDNFFELGGDSIISIQVVSRARQAGIRFTPKELFQHQTVQGLAQVAQLAAGLVIDQSAVVGEAPLAPVQIAFFEQPVPERARWNQSVMLTPKVTLDVALLEQALKHLVTHHDALRMAFTAQAQGWSARYQAPGECSEALVREVRDIELEALEQWGDQAQASLNLECGPLLRAVLANLNDGSQRLLVVIHHLVVDGISWRILFEDLQKAYQQLASGQRCVLPAKTSSFKAWVERLGQAATADTLRAQLDYWEDLLSGSSTDLPVDHPHGSLSNRHAVTVHTQLDALATRQLLQDAPAAYRTQVNDLLLSALARVIGRWTGQDSALIQLEGHGREDLFDDVDLTRTVGWFTSLFAVSLPVESDVAHSIKAVKEQLRAIPDKGIGYGVLRYLGDEESRSRLQALPAPRITFNYLGQFDGSFDDEQALFAPSGEARGLEQSPEAALGNWLTLNGQVYGGELSLGWTFSGQMFDASTVQRLADEYRLELLSVIAHCTALGNGGLTPSDVPLAGLGQRQLDALPLALSGVEDIYPLSAMQQGMLFHTLYEQGGGDYINQMRLDVTGLDPERFRQAWQACVNSHEILRTGFLWQGDLERPLQVVHKHLELPFTVLDWQEHPALDGAIDTLADADRQRGFDLVQAPLLRLTVVRTAPDQCHLIYTSHHILMDGWSNSRLLGEVLQRYSGQEPERQPARYRDYIGWLQSQDPTLRAAFWKQQLAPLQAPTRLAQAVAAPLSAPLSADAGYASHFEVLDSRQTRLLNEFARQQKVTVNTVMQAAWLLLLQRYTGQASVCFGATVAGRPADLKGVEQQIGLFINTLPVIASPLAGETVSHWLQTVQGQNLALREHEHTPLFEIQRWAEWGMESLFDTLLVFENYPISEALAQSADDGLSFGAVVAHEQSNYPLTLSVNAGQTLGLHYHYDRGQFAAGTMAGIARHLNHLLARFMAGSEQVLAQLATLDGDERRLVEQTWNANALDFPRERCIHRQIQDQVQRTPDALAVIWGDEHLTYRQLNGRANALARKLVALGVGPEVRVGVAMPRSAQMVVALLAVLKAGGAYVPLDPDYPAERVAYMLKDSQARVLLTQAAVALEVDASIDVLFVDAQEVDDQDLDVAVHAGNLAYVIYTSGSTGLPKGVAITHRNVAALTQWSQQVYSPEDIQGVLASTSICFDLSVWELFVTLAGGGFVVGARNALELPELAARDRVRLINSVPSAMGALQRAGQIPESVRIINLAGEPLKQSLVDALYGRGHVQHVYDLYGPSEDTTYSTWTRREAGGQANIGKPLANTASYLLDAELHSVPVGVAAELYLAGEGITRGYLLRPGLTAEKFVPNPFSTTGERLYRTGDLTRYRNDGVIEYVGRIDHQVKIRGLRIELGEIESRLLAHPGVREGVVLALDGANGQQLVAYVVLSQATTTQEALRASLREHLPDYMVPTQWLFLEQLPLTPNGKLDRKALPQPDLEPQHKLYIAPHNELEQRIVAIWQDVLKVPQIGVTDNFFELGGDSIISIQVVSRARQAGIRFTPKELFQHQTVQGLASVAQLGEGALLIDQGPVTGDSVLLPIHQAFFDTAIPERHHWNQSVLLKTTQPLNPEHLERALHALLVQHDALRVSFVQQADGWRATYQPVIEQPLLWQRSIADASALEQLGDEAQRSLDLSNGPLLRAVLATLADGSQRLLLVIHHLAVDGVSWRILFEDLQTAYEQLQQGRVVALPAKTSSVKAWGERLARFAREEALEQLPYWQMQLRDAQAQLPSDHSGGRQTNQDGLTVYSRLDSVQTRRLLQDAPAAYRTQINDLLLTALARVICRWTGQASTLIQLEGHGREDLFDEVDLTRSVGWFTSAFPVKLTPAGDPAGSLKNIKEQLRAIPDKGLGFGVLSTFAETQTREAMAQLPAPQITFNYLGQFDSSFDDGDVPLWAPCDEARGPEQNAEAPLANGLILNGQVYAGELSLGWAFSAQRFDESTIQRLADDYTRELAGLVEHCCTSGAGAVTPSDFPLATLSQSALDGLPMTAHSIEDIYPLSPMQQGMLFHTLYEQASGDYINQMCLDVEGLDPDKFRQAWQATLDAHDILRTGFVWLAEQDQPLQIVRKQVTLPYALHDWRGRAGQAQALRQLAEAEQARGFELQEAPLLRLTLVALDDRRHHLILTHHHILMDGWSHSQMLGEVLQRYSGHNPSVSTGRYRDYIAWLQGQDQTLREAFWKQQLESLQAPTRLAQAVVAPRVLGTGYASHFEVLDATQARFLNEFARQQKVTLNTLLQAAWLLLLQRYTGQSTVCFGATVAGRPADLKGVEQQIGLFINTLPVVASPLAGQSVSHWLQAVQAQNLGLREHEHTPLFEIQRWAEHGSESLFDTLLVFENFPIAEALAQGSDNGLVFGAVAAHEQSNYPLTLLVNAGQTLALHYHYDCSVFGSEAMAGIAGHLNRLLVELTTSSERVLADVVMLGDDERQLIEKTWNANALDFPRERCIHQQIQDQVQRTPDALAVIWDDEHLTYRQLNGRANALAHKLVALGVGPEVRVGVAMPRSAQMVVALLAVLKSGGAYVPLDPDYPAERVAYMLKDSQARVLLTQSDVLAAVEVNASIEVLLVEAQDTDDQDPAVVVSATNLAYVIYTSGSTGLPKGVAITHRNVAALTQWSQQVYSPEDIQGVLASTSICFDLSVWELFVTLAGGGFIVGARNALELPELAARDRVRLINSVPSAMGALQRAGQIPESVRIINLAGEPLKQSLVDALYGRGHVQHVYDLYGPSEDTTYSTWTRREAGGQANIGKPLANTASYLLDAELHSVPVGVAAELYLAGEGITRGYLLRPGLTAEKFVPNPFSATGERLYRTGDLTRYRPEGVIEYVGRIDHQVKIRGFRIEMGEIEAQLMALGSVREAVVLAVEGVSGLQLVGYVVPSQPGLIDADAQADLQDDLKRRLHEVLPAYMVPAQLLLLDYMPLTPNGKLDRKALPAPGAVQRRDQYTPPQTDTEQQLAQIWSEVLNVEQVGLEDDFFALGGHSLLATQLIVRIRERMDLQVQLKTLFAASNLRTFSAEVAQLGSASEPLMDELAKSLEALKRLTGDELEKLISE